MMRRLFDALVLPTVSYGSEVWGPFCSPTLPRDIKKMADVQIAFFRQLCRLKRSVTPAIIFRELSEMPWVHRWWNHVIGFMHRLSNMPEDGIHAEILRDNIADAQEHPSYGNWAGVVVKQYSRLGMAWSILHWLQSAQVSWLGLCGPETSPWSAGTSLLASIECHADDRQTLFHPFSLVGCQG